MRGGRIHGGRRGGAAAASPTAADDVAIAHLHMGVAYAGLDHEKAARARFREALQLRRDLTLDPQRFPRWPVRIFEEARRDLPPEAAAGRVARSVVQVLAPDGKPLASAAVVDAAGHSLTILSMLPIDGVRAVLPDGRQPRARVVGRDTLLNVALLALDAAPPPLVLGDSDRLQADERMTVAMAGRRGDRPGAAGLARPRARGRHRRGGATPGAWPGGRARHGR